MAELKPLPYLEWIRTIDSSLVSESDLFAKYNEYLVSWYNTKKKSSSDFNSYRRELYVDLLKEITINYTTAEEQRFLSKINFNDRQELDTIIPFFVTRLNQISKYIIDVRQDLRNVKHVHYLKGSERGVAKSVKDTITNLLNDEDFVDKYPVSNIPAVSSVIDNIYIEIESLYDEYSHYFDTNSTISAAIYTLSADNVLFTESKSNTENIDPNIWLDLDYAIQELLSQIPLLLTVTEDGNDCIYGKSADQSIIGINIPRTDITQLPDSEFVNQLPSKDTLNIVYQGKLVEKYAGTTMYYLSTNLTNTQFVSGVLFEPKTPNLNYLNRYNSGHATIPSKSNLVTLKDIGKFFTPDKEGVLNFERIESDYKLDPTALEANTIYVFPDPDEYGTGRGNSLLDVPSVLIHTDDNTRIRSGKESQTQYGDIVNDRHIQKFYPYQSVEESLQLQSTGISRWHDDIDFWEGDEKDIWSKSDIYVKKSLRPYPVEEKQSDLLIREDSLYQWKTDIYGNEFALFKQTRPVELTTNQTAGTYTNTAVQNTGDTSHISLTGEFSDPKHPYFQYQLSNNTTKYEQKTSPLSAVLSVYDRYNLETADFYFRNVYSSEISPTSSALSAIFIKYEKDEDIKTELNNNIKAFDIIGNVILVETKNFFVVEKFEYDLTNNSFESILPLRVMVSISGDDSNFSRFGNPWYDERTENIYFFKTSLHPFLSASNSKLIYPTIYSYNINDNDFREVYSINTLAPGSSGTVELDQDSYNLLYNEGYVVTSPYSIITSVTGDSFNITRIDRPFGALSTLENTYTINFFGYEPSDAPILHNWYYDTTDRKALTKKQLDVFTPNRAVFNHNIGNYQTVLRSNGMLLSGNIQSNVNRGGSETRPISLEGVQSQVVFGDDESVVYPLSFGTTASGRHAASPGVIDTDKLTVRLGSGLSASKTDAQGAGSVEEADTAILPYTHNTGYLLNNSGLSGIGNDIVVTFDVAMYTITTQNSAYAQVIHD